MCTSAPQTITKTNSTAKTAAVLTHVVLTILSAASIASPVTSSMPPIVVKSSTVQFTSLVNFTIP